MEVRGWRHARPGFGGASSDARRRRLRRSIPRRLKTVRRSARLTGNAAKVLLPLALPNGARLDATSYDRARSRMLTSLKTAARTVKQAVWVYGLLLVTRRFRGTPRRLGYPTLLKMCERMAAQMGERLAPQERL